VRVHREQRERSRKPEQREQIDQPVPSRAIRDAGEGGRHHRRQRHHGEHDPDPRGTPGQLGDEGRHERVRNDAVAAPTATFETSHGSTPAKIPRERTMIRYLLFVN
jgi:hypothetical protein